jgi:hypothetical protein
LLSWEKLLLLVVHDFIDKFRFKVKELEELSWQEVDSFPVLLGEPTGCLGEVLRYVSSSRVDVGIRLI